MKKRTKLLFWCYFWRYGVLGLMLIAAIAVGFTLNAFTSTRPYTMHGAFGVLAFFCTLIGGDYIIATIKRMPHIFLVSQSCYHIPPTPDNIDWEDFSAKEFIGIGIIFWFLSVLFILLCILL